MFCYEPTSSPLDNYHVHPPLAGAGHSWLATRFPAPFEEVTPLFPDRLGAREATLGESPVSEAVGTK